jgi:hypothetical protein
MGARNQPIKIKVLRGGILQNTWESPRFCGLHMEVKVYIWLVLVYPGYFSDIILVYTLFAYSTVSMQMMKKGLHGCQKSLHQRLRNSEKRLH